ncbi:hypothetical protein GJ496_011984 [Pomphorhynchus laevis]|nr:hypothetical protein GJ496_011984 [Pomphorhynchus laevis]
MIAYILGILSILFFYLLVLLVGLWAAKYKNKFSVDSDGSESEDIIVAGRNIGTIVGVFTMTATWVGGGYINGTAESTLVLGGLFFAKRMRREGFVTMLDPFQRKFGSKIGGILFLPALLGEIFWVAAILSALGASIKVILGFNDTVSIVLSAFVAILYTMFGGLYSVAYTDVIQLFLIFAGLWISIPFAWKSKFVSFKTLKRSELIGQLKSNQIGPYLDTLLLLMLGGIPWQVYFQRVLSSRSEKRAMYISYAAAVGCVVMAIPSILIGVIAKCTDWNQTSYIGIKPIPPDDQKLILPLVLQYLTPTYISFIGLGAISAAVMSSADSSVLSASSMYARNVWKLVFRNKASEREIILVMRIGILVIGSVASLLAIFIKSVYTLWVLSADLVYVIIFPQLVCVTYISCSNTYGSLSSYLIALILRVIGGEDTIGIPALVRYPFYNYADKIQIFPFRTFSMLIGLITHIFVSVFTDHIFKSGKLSSKYDFFKCVTNIPAETIPLKERSSMIE